MNNKQVNKILKQIKKDFERAWDSRIKVECDNNSYITCELPMETVYMDFNITPTDEDIKKIGF